MNTLLQSDDSLLVDEFAPSARVFEAEQVAGSVPDVKSTFVALQFATASEVEPSAADIAPTPSDVGMEGDRPLRVFQGRCWR